LAGIDEREVDADGSAADAMRIFRANYVGASYKMLAIEYAADAHRAAWPEDTN